MLFSEAQIAAFRLRLRQIPFFAQHELVWLPETGSTNDDLKRDWSLPVLPARLEITESQTAGRGQFERAWKNNAEQCLMFSFSFQTGAPAFPVSLSAGIALYSAISRFCAKVSPELWLKWPNDVYYARRKLAGILVESAASAGEYRFVVGIGVNLRPLERAEIASAGLGEIVAAVVPVEFLYAFCHEWDSLFSMDSENLATLWARCASGFWSTDFLLTSPDGSESKIRPLSIDASGALLVAEKNGTRRKIFSGSLKPLFQGLFNGDSDPVGE